MARQLWSWSNSIRASDIKGIQQSFANHIAFAVEDIESIVAKLKKKGTELFEYKTIKTLISYVSFVGQKGLF